jgi:hypothetical protein
MEHNDCHVHDNHMVFGIVCCSFVCFMFTCCVIMEKGNCRHFVYLDLEGELACLSILVFALHEDRWEYGLDQCTRL